ncbi:hypothetical protein K1W69_25850 [Hoeflea sp. WL0058]|uniref:Uncharacterized protein n=1 Tax=Flavimaribacter sediminis TaxID=2865987 RepID=A0AAE3D4A9_9HYPH|nr:hypothetical protein [Flavimaribacter sediminis]MBW8640643.1 hypothetical protein [Flavimaribacter sediminis]
MAQQFDRDLHLQQAEFQMEYYQSAGRIWGLAILLLTFGVSTASAATNCSPISYGAERSKLRVFLASNGYAQSEQTFLLRGSDRRVREIRSGQLNDRGVECGVKKVRAYVLGCMNNSLPWLLRSVASPAERTTVKLWGKARVSRREAAFIGKFHLCRAGAMEVFFKPEELD